MKGFDLYQYPHSSPTDSFATPRAECCVQEATFLENESAFASGSDHGKIYIFSLKSSSQCLQVMKQGGKKTMIQVVDVSYNGCLVNISNIPYTGMFYGGKPPYCQWYE